MSAKRGHEVPIIGGNDGSGDSGDGGSGGSGEGDGGDGIPLTWMIRH